MVEIDGMLFPFDNKIVRNNLGNADLASAFEFVTNFSLAVDAGAFVGRTTRTMQKVFRHVVAVEIAKENFECLLKNAPEATAIHACLGREHGWQGYEPDKHPDSPVYRVKKGADVLEMTLDSFCLVDCGFIKMDLQGYEFEALIGSEITIRTYKPVLMLEMDEKCLKHYGASREKIERLLKSWDYKLRKSDGKDQIWTN